MKSFVSFHLIPFIISATFAALIFNSGILNHLIFPIDKKALEIKFPEITTGYYSNYDKGYQAEVDVCYALLNKSIVVIGSSELAQSSSALPFSFIPALTNYPVLGLGHAGNQCLCILAQLSAMSEYVENSNVVIILSPMWFSKQGTSLQSFLEFNDTRFMVSVLTNQKLPVRFRDYIAEYVAANFHNINSPNAALLLMNSSGASLNKIKKIAFGPIHEFDKLLFKNELKAYNFLIEQGYQATNILMPNKNKLIDNSEISNNHYKVNWDSLAIMAIDLARANSTSNSWGIDNDYYKKYLGGGRGEMVPVKIDANKEFKDFLVLLDFLKTYHVNASFIIQPMNPYFYKYITDFDPIIQLIAEEIHRSDFDCLNLFTSDTSNYEKAVLKDVMHMGDYGWYKMNRFIMEKYLPYEKRAR